MAYNIYNNWITFDGYYTTAEMLGDVYIGCGYRPKSGSGSIYDNNLGTTNSTGTIIFELEYSPSSSVTSNTSYVGLSTSTSNPTLTDSSYWLRDTKLIPFPYNYTSTPGPARIVGSSLPKTSFFSYHNIDSSARAVYPKWAGTATSTESKVPYAEVGVVWAYFNEWASLTSKDGNSFYYAITAKQSNVWEKVTLSVSAGYEYTFEMGTYSQAGNDGILISTSNLSSGTINTTTGRIGRCSGIHVTSSCTYTPLANGTVYIYFKTDSSTLGRETLKYDASNNTDYYYDDGYTYGNVKVTRTLVVQPGRVDTAPTNNSPRYNSGGDLCTAGSGTGTMYYRLGDSGSFSTAIPTTSGLNVGTYTVYYYAAASTNYTQSSIGSITVTVVKASNQITISTTSETIYDRPGYKSFYLTVSNHKGTPTASVNTSGRVTISSFDSTNARFTVTYASAGSVTITVSDSSINYATSTVNCGVTTKVDSITNSNYSPSNYTASVSIGSGLAAGGGSVTVAASASHTAYNLYESGWYGESHTVGDSVSWSITSNGNSRFSKSGSTLSHSSMGCSATTDTVTVTAVNGSSSSATATASKSIVNEITNSNYSPSNYGASISITNKGGLTCAGGSSAVAATAYHLAYNYYTSGSYCDQHTVYDSVSWSITSNGNNRFSQSGNTLSHNSMGTSATTDTVTVTAVNGSNSSATATDTASITNSVTNSNYAPSNYTASVSIGDGLNAAGGEATVTASASHLAYDYYCSGDYNNQHTVYDSVSWSITSNGNSRFSKSGNKVTHSSMGTSVTTDKVVVTAVNDNSSSATATAEKSISNAVTNYDYSSSNSGYTVDVSIGSGLNCGTSSATVSVSGSHTHTYYYLYTSGSTSGPYYTYPTDSPTWSITSQYLDSSSNTITRFSKSGNTLSHSSMGTTTGVDYVTITANNNGTTKTASTNVTNAVTNYDYNSSNSGYAVNVSIGSGLTAGTTEATVSVSGYHAHTYYYLYASGSTSGPYTATQNDGPTWSITSQYLNSSGNTITRFSKSGNTLSHATMCETLGTDYVTITATNNTATKTASATVTNTRWDTNLSSYWASISISNKNGITCAGGSSSVSVSAGHSAKYTYTSGCVSSDTHSVSDGVSWSITSNGNSRFSKSGNTLSHSSMTTNVTTDTVVVTAVNDNSSSATATDTTSVSNTITNSNYNPSGYWSSVYIGNGMTCSGGSATVTASAGHDAYNYYCSGSADSSTHIVFDSASWSITSNGNNRFSKSGNTLSHGNMTTNGVTDTVTVTAVNDNSSSATSTDSKSISNPITDTNYSPSNYTASVSIGDGLTAGGGSATVTASASHLAYDLYCSGSYNNQHTVNDSVSWSITGNGNSRFSKSGNTLSHSSMGTSVTTDTVTVTAVNDNSSSATATDSKSISNVVTNSDYDGSNSGYWASVSIGSGMTAGGGSATVSASAGHTHTYYYYYTSGSTSGPYTSYPGDSVTWEITANGNNRFSQSGNTLSHSSMGTSVTTDTVTVKATNGSSSSATATDSKSISNVLEGITFTVGSKTISYQGTTKGTVTARYTSGSTKDVENSANTSYTDAANPDIVTFTKTS